MSAAALAAAARAADLGSLLGDSVRATTQNPLGQVFFRLTLRAAAQITAAVGAGLVVALLVRALYVAVGGPFEEEQPRSPPPPPPPRAQRRQREQREEDDAAWQARLRRAALRGVAARRCGAWRVRALTQQSPAAQEEEDRRWAENERRAQTSSGRRRNQPLAQKERYYYDDD